MAVSISVSVQRRIYFLDGATVLALVCSLLALSSILITSLCLFFCLFFQAVIFRVHFKYTNDSASMLKRVGVVIGCFIAILALLFHNNLI